MKLRDPGSNRVGVPWRESDAGLRVVLRVIPRARHDQIEGLVTLPDGQSAIKVKVTAAPADGKANAALLKLLAKAWGIPKTQLRIAVGETARTKTILIADESKTAARRLAAWLAGTAA